MNKRLVLGISGASGFIYGLKALELLENTGIETHLVVSDAARIAGSYEIDLSYEALCAKATFVHDIADIGASIASGSFLTCGMLIAPCSVNTLASIAHGIAGNLMTRAADVVLKERRRLVLMLRETPLHVGHLKNMLLVSEMGGIIYPPVPAFYKLPKNIDDIVAYSVSRALSLFEIEVGNFLGWKE